MELSMNEFIDLLLKGELGNYLQEQLDKLEELKGKTTTNLENICKKIGEIEIMLDMYKKGILFKSRKW
jgi:hypothetical protein